MTGRQILFIFGCLGMRLLLAIIAKKINIKYLPIMGYLCLIPALGFLIIYFGNFRKTGIEVGGDKIWWNDLRPVHALMYCLFAIYAIKKKSFAWIVLLVDVCIGLIAFTVHYTRK